MNCNPEIHDEMITMEYVKCKCPFGDQQSKEIIIKQYPCCDEKYLS